MTKILACFFTWIVVYIAVTSSLIGFQRAGLDLSLPIQTLILTAFLVPIMVFFIAPRSASLAQKIISKFGA